MDTFNDFDSNSYSPLPLTHFDELLNGSSFVKTSNTFEFNNLTTTPIAFNPSSNHNNGPYTSLDFDSSFIHMINHNNPRFSIPNTNSLPNTQDICFDEALLNDYQNEKIQIIAQPKASYRARYMSETNTDKNQAKRFIRSEKNDSKHVYPTIKIPSWCHQNRSFYIRVTLVTVPNEKKRDRYIHPHPIDTLDENVIKDKENNSLYFRINENDYLTYKKHFRIFITKKKQVELQLHGPMHLFDNKAFINANVENLDDPKQIISLYRLCESQFVFTVAERQDNYSIPVPLYYTSIESQVMIDKAIESRNSLSELSYRFVTNQIKFIPQQANWFGGEEIVIIMPNPVKQKKYTITFDFGGYGQISIQEIIPIDTKTLLFRTPTCPLIPGEQDLKISILIQDNKVQYPSIAFTYLTPLKTVINICSSCQRDIISTNNKKRHLTDGVIHKMTQLSMQQPANKEKIKQLEKFIDDLKDAMEIFLRENDPSKLFRRTRALLSTFDGKSSPLIDAIERGYTDLSLSLIKQIIDLPSPNRLLEDENENGDTVLLMAGKKNEWKIIECIIKSRNDLIKQKDKNGNNLLHILGNVSEDKGVETIINVLKILPKELKMNLLNEENRFNQKPIDIAKFQCDISF